MNMEIEMNGTVYQFIAGMGFVREANKSVKSNGTNIGLRTIIGGLLDGDIEALENVLMLMNKGCVPRLSQTVIDEYIENEDTDIDELFKKTLDFLSNAQCTRRAYMMMLSAAGMIPTVALPGAESK